MEVRNEEVSLKLVQIVLRKSSHTPVGNSCSAPPSCVALEQGCVQAEPSASPIFKMTHSLFPDDEVWVYPKPAVTITGESQRMLLEGSPGKGQMANLK